MATIDLNRVSTFVRVVEGASFTAAARALGVPISSASRSVARLEADLGVRLLHRTTRKLRLTEAGEAYFRRMQAVMAEAADAADAVAGFATAPAGLVRLTAPPDLRLHQIVSALLTKHPGLEIELTLTSRPIDLVEEGYDLAIRGGILTDSSLMVRKIADTPLGLFAAPAYLTRAGRPRALRDLSRHACVLFRGRPGPRTWQLIGPRGPESVTVRGTLTVDDMGFLRGALLEGLGLGLVPAALLSSDVAAGTLVRVLPKYQLGGGGLFLVWPSRRLMPPRVAAVRDFLADEITKIL
jgi:DNA-binding transcriptional LysR family regulator